MGRAFGPRLEARIARNERLWRRRVWAERKLLADGGMLLLAARFVRGGRTATTLTAGLVWRRFGLITLIAGTAWAAGIGLLGYAGGKAVEDNPYLGLLFLLAIAVGVYGAISGMKWLRRRFVKAPGRAAAGVGLAMPQIRVDPHPPRLGA